MNDHRRLRILLVEDDEDNRELFAEFLSEEFDVSTAPDAEAGLATFLRERPDVVITDQNLPGMTGTALAMQIKKACPLAGVVLVSGHNRLSGVGDCDAVLEKPLNLEALSHLLGKVSQQLRDGRC